MGPAPTAMHVRHDLRQQLWPVSGVVDPSDLIHRFSQQVAHGLVALVQQHLEKQLPQRWFVGVWHELFRESRLAPVTLRNVLERNGCSLPHFPLHLTDIYVCRTSVTTSRSSKTGGTSDLCCGGDDLEQASRRAGNAVENFDRLLGLIALGRIVGKCAPQHVTELGCVHSSEPQIPTIFSKSLAFPRPLRGGTRAPPVPCL